jgi:hypothetical protein
VFHTARASGDSLRRVIRPVESEPALLGASPRLLAVGRAGN